MMPRYLTALSTDIVIDYPKSMRLDPEDPDFQKHAREEFIEFLKSAEHIKLGFEIDTEETE